MADSHREEIAKLETLYANNPEGRVFTHLAEAYRKAGELERAREILQDGLRRHSDYSSAHVVLGRVLADQGEPDSAAAAFRRVLELDRHNLVALRSLGEISSETGRIDEALHYYRELLSLDPSDERMRGTVRALEERRELEASRPAQVHTPAPATPATEEPAHAPEPSGEPPAIAAGEPVPPETPVPEFIAGPAVPFVPDVPTAEPTPETSAGEPPAYAAPAEPLSQNWEEDVGIELEAMPGDLGALAEEASAEALPESSIKEPAAEEEWAVSSEWLAQPPADPLASGLDLGIEGEEIGRFELPASDLDLTEPAGDELTPFDMPGGPLDLAPGEPDEPTPFDMPDTADAAEVPPESVYGAVGSAEGFEIDVGPVTPEFGGPDEGAAAAAELETVPEEPEPVWSAEFEPEPVAEVEPETVPPAFEPAEPEPVRAELGPAMSGESEPVREEGELVTETMAELYFAQGFYARAAEVYRSLLRDRPGDARLERRLADAEAMSATPQAAGDVAEEAGEAWLEGVESAWTGGRGVAGGETTPYAWAEPRAEETPAGPHVGEYFRSLLSWRPGAGEGPGVVADEERARFEAEQQREEPGLAYDAADTEAPAYLPMEALEEQGADVEADTAEPWDAPEPVRAPELPEAASVAGAEDDGADDDEDLEMFRSWLQSLRK